MMINDCGAIGWNENCVQFVRVHKGHMLSTNFHSLSPLFAWRENKLDSSENGAECGGGGHVTTHFRY